MKSIFSVVNVELHRDANSFILYTNPVLWRCIKIILLDKSTVHGLKLAMNGNEYTIPVWL